MCRSFDDQLLQAFMNNFFGYGNYEAPYWFIGMEEGGGNSFEEVEKRFTVWYRRGRHELEDVAAYHQELGITYLFGEKPKLQPTWAALIRILLSINGHTPTTEDVRLYQRDHWARNNDACLLELLPLPSPSTSQWLYSQYSRLPSLIDRNKYRHTWSKLRIQALGHRIAEYHPKLVVMYGFSYQSYWREVVGNNLNPELAGDMYVYDGPDTLFVVTKHPVATGVSNAYFLSVGQQIQQYLVGQTELS